MDIILLKNVGWWTWVVLKLTNFCHTSKLYFLSFRITFDKISHSIMARYSVK